MTRDPYEIVVLLEDYEEKRMDYLRQVKMSENKFCLMTKHERVVREAELLAKTMTAWVRLERARQR